jgi:WD40 repeat protein
MSEVFQKLQVKKYPKKEYKNAAESRYWKKYKDVVKQKSAYSVMDTSFCGNQPDFLCVAVSAKVDIYKITKNLFESEIKAINSLYKFNDVVTCCKLRDNKDVVAVGTREGIVHIMQTKKKLSLRKYTTHRHSINTIAFSDNKINLATGADESDVHIWELALQQPLLTLENAHEDYVKKVEYHETDSTLMTSGYDRCVKLWDIKGKLKASYLVYMEF